MNGIRHINGKEFLLSGRFYSKEEANTEAVELLKEWTAVKVRKIPHVLGSYSCWVHGVR